MKKEKTDTYFVSTLVCIGILGLAMAYIGRVTGTLWEKVDRLELKVDLMHDDLIILPQHQTDGPSIFEGLGIDKDGNIEE